MQQSLLTSGAPSVAQALSQTRDNGYDKAAGYKKDTRDDVQFHEVMREKRIEQDLKVEQLRETHRKEADLHAENRKTEAREAAAKDHALKADRSTPHEEASAAEDADSTAQVPVVANDTEQETHVEHGVSALSNPLQPTQLPHDIQKILQSVDTGALKGAQSLTIDASQFDALSDLEKIQFLSVMNSLQVDGAYNPGGRNGLNTIEGFINNLVQQYAQNDPSATLSNLTPQQVTQIRNHLAQHSGGDAGREMLNSILALQNIDPDTALSRGGPGGVHAGLDRQDIIGQALNGPILEQISGILAGMAQIVKPVAAAGVKSAEAALPSPNAIQGIQTEQQLAARLHNLSTAGNTPAGAGLNNTAPDLLGLDGEMPDAEFDRLMSRFSADPNMKGYTPAEPTRAQALSAQDAPASPAPQAAKAPHISLLPAALTGADGALSVADSILQELGLTGTLVNGTAAQGVGLSNIVTSAQTAGAAHPAAQTVAATLHKAANGGVNKAITIRLDPPELGRVEIKMSFESNSKIKAVLRVENPETHLMMQRDQQLLERALQNAGFDTEGALQFELAQDGHGFDQDGSHDNFHQGQNGEQVPEDDVDVVHTTMTWSENANTGHISYDLLV